MIVSVFFSNSVYSTINLKRIEFFKKGNVDKIKGVISSSYDLSRGYLPKSLILDNQNYSIKYTLNEKLESFSKKLLKKFHPDHAAIVVLDNKTGAIISAVDFNRKSGNFGKSLVFSSSHPAASVFKVITAAALFENTSKKPDSQYSFRGRSNTLYRFQLNSKKNNRTISFSRAFAKSNNVIFGKVAMNELGVGQIYEMAKKFKFETKYIDDLDIAKSVLKNPDNSFEMAELGSGFNRETKISPLHGAIIASIVSNNGSFYKPYLIDSIYNKYFKKNIYEAQRYKKRVLSYKTSSYLKEVMGKTLSIGTGRRTFRKFKLLDFLEVGGKTGSITGGLPHGKRDWFIAYAKPKFSSENGISICVMIVNKKKWYVKSTLLAKKIIQYYYTGLN